MSGRAECAWCQADLGPRPRLATGVVSHGCCAKCKEQLFADVAALPIVEPTNRIPPPSSAIDEECST